MINHKKESIYLHFKLPLCLSYSIAAIAILFLAMCSYAYAAESKLTSKLYFSGGYDDNITYVRSEKIDSSILKAEPGIEWDYKSLLSSLKIIADLDMLAYLDDNDYNRIDQNYSLQGKHRFTERWDTRIGLQYTQDTTLNTYLEETGQLTNQVDRDFYYGTAGFSYEMTQVSILDIDYRYQHAEYEKDIYSNYGLHRLNIRYRHRLKNEIDTFLLGPSFYHRENDSNDTDYISLDMGWKRKWSEITNSFASIGARYATMEDNDGNDKDRWGVKAKLDLIHRGIKSDITFKYYHDLSTLAQGTDVNVDNFHLEYQYMLAERFGVGLRGRLVFTYGLFDKEQDSVDNRYYKIGPYLFYRLSKNLKLYLRYRYQITSDDLIENENTNDRSSAWIEIRYEAPFSFNS